MTDVTYRGGCHCGAIRFEAKGAPKFVARCHCDSCRRTTGGAFSTWVGFEDPQVEWLSDADCYCSSEGVRRGFCKQCGTPLSYQSDKWVGETHFLIGVFDEPYQFVPSGDVFTEEALPWCHGGGHMQLRAASPADLNLLRHWDEQRHVIAADPNDDWGWEEELHRTPEWRELLIAELDGRPIGFMQIIDPALEDSHYWGDVADNLRAVDIWIGEAADLGRGYGTTMMQLALERCFAHAEVTAVLIDPLATNTRAHRFYERLGFRFVERRQFGDDDCFVYRLERAGWQRDGFEGTAS
ncbi:GNAT family N-acetyltransferase [Microbulbifer taiwanensis]|uniref:GNAT family N-acetyltransferase n=1 Tax=Microbulbifer taiwanensis TaxID=986746 RepID=A0ABW1YQS5_9GAMM|nr:GNAT family N-acetyltransferase [Microbulbifer taiwanensis]